MAKDVFTLSAFEIQTQEDIKEYAISKIREKHPTGEITSIMLQGTSWGMDVEYEIDEQVK